MFPVDENICDIINIFYVLCTLVYFYKKSKQIKLSFYRKYKLDCRYFKTFDIASLNEILCYFENIAVHQKYFDVRNT